MRLLTVLLFAAAAFAQAPVIQTNDPLPEADAGISYSLQLSATNQPASWTIVRGILPPWASWDGAHGTIRGVPDAPGLYRLTIKATNGSGDSVPVNFVLAVFATPILSRSGHNWTLGDAAKVFPSLTYEQARRLNGRALKSINDNGNQFACGDQITLSAGATYLLYTQVNTPGLDKARAFYLNAQTCAPGQITRFVSSNLDTLSFTGPNRWRTLPQDQKSAYLANMPRIIAPLGSPDGTAIQTFYTNNYYFGGIALLSDAVSFPGWNCGSVPNCWVGSVWAPGYNRGDAHFNGGGTNVEIDRCYLGSFNGFAYGSIADWYRADANAQADINTWERFFHANNITMILEGDDYYVHDTILEAGGYDWTADDPEFACDAGTNSKPAVLHCPGVAAKLGISQQAACYPNGAGTVPTLAGGGCNGAGGMAIAVIRGARGGWGSTATDGTGLGKLNGAKALLYKDADDVYVFEAWTRRPWLTDNPIDSTSWGPFTGTVEGKDLYNTGHTVVFALTSGTGSQNARIVNNFLDSPGWNIFLGGADTVTTNTATVTAGSTWNKLNLTLAAGSVAPKVGDWLIYYTWSHPLKSAQCGFTAADRACVQANFRVGIVTAVGGATPNLTVSLTGANAGFNATSANAIPDMPGGARWAGRTTCGWLISGNTLFMEPMIVGKDYFEAKEGCNTLVTGNQFIGTPGSAFVTTHGWNPWTSAAGIHFSHNLFGGDPEKNEGGSAAAVLVGQDSEASTIPSDAMQWTDNVCAGCSNTGFGFWYGGTGIKVAHNTSILAPWASAPFISAGDDICKNPDQGTYFTAPGLTIADNLLSYGSGYGGAIHGICDNLPAGVNNNLLINDRNAAVPGWVPAQKNTTVPNLAAAGTIGTCDFAHWTDCALADNSKYKGTASDGLDPGADITAVQDRLNRWSERAGILSWGRAEVALINNPAAWSISPTAAILRFTSLDPDPNANCTFHLYTDRARTIEHPDTIGSGNFACARIGNQVSGTNVTLIFGNRVPLTPGTTYSYSIRNGSDPGCVSDSRRKCGRTMVGVFTTARSAQATQSWRHFRPQPPAEVTSAR